MPGHNKWCKKQKFHIFLNEQQNVRLCHVCFSDQSQRADQLDFLLRACCQSKSVSIGEMIITPTLNLCELQLLTRANVTDYLFCCYWDTDESRYWQYRASDWQLIQITAEVVLYSMRSTPVDMWYRHNVKVLPVMWWNNLIIHAEECPERPLLCFANFCNKWSTVCCLFSGKNEARWARNITKPETFPS